MNGLYNLRRTPSEVDNRLLDYWQRHQAISPVYETPAPVLLGATPENAPSPVNNALYDFYNPPTTDVVAPVLQQATPVTPTNALLRATAPVTKPVAEKPTNALLDYWAKPVIGKMPLDQFVQIAGALSSAIAPREPVGRVGNVLAQIGGQAYAERMKEPENILRRRLLEAQAKKLEEPQIPQPWEAFSKSLRGTIDPDTQRTYTEGKIVQKYHESIRGPKEPKIPTPRTIPTIQDGMFGEFETTTKIFTPIRKATAKDIEDIETGKIAEPKRPALDFEYKNIGGIPHKRQIQWDPITKQEIPRGDWIRMEKLEKPEKAEKLSMTDVKSAYSMDIGNIKNQMMIEMTPDEQMNLAGQPDVNILALLMAGRVGKSLSPERKNYYIGRLQEAETYYGDLINQVLGRKGAKIPPKIPSTVAPEIVTPNLLTDIEYKGPVATGKIGPRVIAPEEIFKDKQGREMVKDPTSSTGWRYR